MDYVTYFTAVAATAAIGVVVVQQILKLKFIPVSFANKFPVPTLLVLSIIASLIAVFSVPVVAPTEWWGWVVLVVTIAVVAAIIYNNILKNWDELRATEGYVKR